MNPKIISIGVDLPQTSYPQLELLEMIGYQSPASRRIFRNARIDKRYIWINPVGLSWQELTQHYVEGATHLASQAIIDCLDGMALDSFGCLVFSSCTGYSCPGISHHVAKRLNLPPNLTHSNMLGMGCEASAPALARARDYVVVHRRPAMMVTCELASCAYYPGSEDDMENVVSNSLFGDGAAAILVGYDDDPSHPQIIDIQSYFDQDYMDYLGFKWADGRLKCVLHKDVPIASSKLVGEAIRKLLKDHGMTKEDVDHWAIHPGGVKVLENIQQSLGLDEAAVEASYEVMRQYGNVSSATVIMIGKYLNRVRPPATAVAVTMGAGFEVGTCLLRWS